MNFQEYLFKTHTEEIRQKPALISGKEKVTYEEIESGIVAMMEALDKYTKQDRILILAENSIEFVVSYLSVIGKGLVAVPIFSRSSPSEIEYIARDVMAKAVIFHPKLKSKVENLNMDKIEVMPANQINKKSRISPVPVQDHDLAVINYTSGSTGRPKGVMTSHRNLISNTASIIEYLNLSSSDRFLLVLPLAYCYGASWLHTLFKVGGTIYINNQFIFTSKLIEQMLSEKITGFGGVPSHYQILLRKSNFLEYDYPHLRFLAQAGGKLQVPYIKELVEKFGEERVYIMYGQTEATARLSYLPPNMLKSKMGSIGKGIPGVELRVVNDNFEDIKPGEVGELVAKGDNIMLGYWNDPDESNKVLKHGYLFTGDLATVDEDGFIYIVDRKKTMIKSGGYRVSSKEIENAIAECKNVVEVAVVGAPDELKGEIPVAFVVLNDPSGLELVVETYKAKLPKFKWPDKIVPVKALPKNESGKVLYAELKKFAANPIDV